MENEDKQRAYQLIQEINRRRLESGGRGKYPYTDREFEHMWENNRDKIEEIIKTEIWH